MNPFKILMILIMALCLYGCGSDDDDDDEECTRTPIVIDGKTNWLCLPTGNNNNNNNYTPSYTPTYYTYNTPSYTPTYTPAPTTPVALQAMGVKETTNRLYIAGREVVLYEEIDPMPQPATVK